MSSQIQFPALLPVTSLKGGGVNPTAVLDTVLPCHISLLATERRTDLQDARKLLCLGFNKLRQENGTRDDAVGWGTAQEAGISRVQFPIMSIKIYIDVIFRPYCDTGFGWAAKVNEYRNISYGKNGHLRRADKLTAFMCRWSWYLGSWTCWNPKGLLRPVQGLLHFLSQENNLLKTEVLVESVQGRIG